MTEAFQVTGDGHRGIGHSGVGPSALGHRLRVPAAGSRAAGAWTPGSRARNLSPENESLSNKKAARVGGLS